MSSEGLRVESIGGVERLGKNVNGYLGETVDIPVVLREIEEFATRQRWQIESFLEADQLRLMALHRGGMANTATGAGPRVYISAGIHGDEPAGPLAVRELLLENRWPGNPELWICPCLNPAGFRLNRRENAAGLDLNRQYLQPTAEETLAHIAWLGRQPKFDLCLCLHEDWESHGFYVYELNPDQQPTLAEAIVGAVASVCPIDRSEVIEGRPAEKGIIRPSVDPRSRPQWPESFFLLSNHTRLSYTLEAPSDFPLKARVAALKQGVQAALEKFESERANRRENRS